MQVNSMPVFLAAEFNYSMNSLCAILRSVAKIALSELLFRIPKDNGLFIITRKTCITIICRDIIYRSIFQNTNEMGQNCLQ